MGINFSFPQHPNLATQQTPARLVCLSSYHTESSLTISARKGNEGDCQSLSQWSEPAIIISALWRSSHLPLLKPNESGATVNMFQQQVLLLLHLHWAMRCVVNV